MGVAEPRDHGEPLPSTTTSDKDGRWFWIVGLEGDRHWPPLWLAAVGHPEWIDDPRFAGREERAANAGVVIGLLDEIFATRTRDEWAEVFAAEPDMWWAPVQDTLEVMADPQVHAGGGFVDVPDEGTTTRLPSTPVDFAGSTQTPRGMAPSPGQQTDEVLAELGRDASAIAALREKGIVA